MAAPKGNQFWKARATHGRKPIYDDPDKLWEVCQEYFEWVNANPLMESEVVKFQGKATITEVPKMRAMTIGGLCLFLGISHETWNQWRGSRDDLSEVITRVDAIIYEHKFTGAAANLLNPNIIARDLGLADKKELNAVGITKIERIIVDPKT